jgi:tight adherence protein C
MNVLNFLTGLCMLFFTLSMISFYRHWTTKAKLQLKVDALIEQAATKTNVRLQEKWMRILIRWAGNFASIGSKFTFFSKSAELEVNLSKAGKPFGIRVQDIHGLKILLAFVGFLFGFIMMVPLFFLGPANLIIFALIGYFAPMLWLRARGKRRQSEISKEIPDFLDTISITLHAGLSLDVALLRYVESTTGPWTEEMSQYNDEIKLGVSRDEALQNLYQRTQNPDVENLVNDLLQAIRLGVPLARTFQLQAEGMRKIREERVKEVARKAGPKLALVATLVFTPSIMAFILGVMILSFMKGMHF